MTNFGQAPRTDRLTSRAAICMVMKPSTESGVVHRFARTGIGCPKRCHARHIYRREVSVMDQIESARARLQYAIRLPAVLDAAYDAFEEMLGEIENHQDGDGQAFGAFVMSGAAAANGRNALAAAPSLPPGPSGDLARVRAAPSPDLELEDAAVALAGLSQLLSARLAAASDLSADVRDQVACAQAARHAASICSLLGGIPRP